MREFVIRNLLWFEKESSLKKIYWGSVISILSELKFLWIEIEMKIYLSHFKYHMMFYFFLHIMFVFLCCIFINFCAFKFFINA